VFKRGFRKVLHARSRQYSPKLIDQAPEPSTATLRNVGVRQGARILKQAHRSGLRPVAGNKFDAARRRRRDNTSYRERVATQLNQNTRHADGAVSEEMAAEQNNPDQVHKDKSALDEPG
jgi:hypothetical protein